MQDLSLWSFLSAGFSVQVQGRLATQRFPALVAQKFWKGKEEIVYVLRVASSQKYRFSSLGII